VGAWVDGGVGGVVVRVLRREVRSWRGVGRGVVILAEIVNEA